MLLIKKSNQKGLFLIYSHYPIFIGLIMMTVSMSFLLNPEVNRLFATSFSYIGFGLFQAAVLVNGPITNTIFAIRKVTTVSKRHSIWLP